jgi:hypothetical protein
VFLSVEFGFTLRTYRKGAPFYNASAYRSSDLALRRSSERITDKPETESRCVPKTSSRAEQPWNYSILQRHIESIRLSETTWFWKKGDYKCNGLIATVNFRLNPSFANCRALWVEIGYMGRLIYATGRVCCAVDVVVVCSKFMGALLDLLSATLQQCRESKASAGSCKRMSCRLA